MESTFAQEESEGSSKHVFCGLAAAKASPTIAAIKHTGTIHFDMAWEERKRRIIRFPYKSMYAPVRAHTFRLTAILSGTASLRGIGQNLVSVCLV